MTDILETAVSPITHCKLIRNVFRWPICHCSDLTNAITLTDATWWGLNPWPGAF